MQIFKKYAAPSNGVEEKLDEHKYTLTQTLSEQIDGVVETAINHVIDQAITSYLEANFDAIFTKALIGILNDRVKNAVIEKFDGKLINVSSIVATEGVMVQHKAE